MCISSTGTVLIFLLLQLFIFINQNTAPDLESFLKVFKFVHKISLWAVISISFRPWWYSKTALQAVASSELGPVLLCCFSRVSKTSHD